ncbi:hypothetical protein PCE1_004553 [Barthelona sp. PCE]
MDQKSKKIQGNDSYTHKSSSLLAELRERLAKTESLLVNQMTHLERSNHTLANQSAQLEAIVESASFVSKKPVSEVDVGVLNSSAAQLNDDIATNVDKVEKINDVHGFISAELSNLQQEELPDHSPEKQKLEKLVETSRSLEFDVMDTAKSLIELKQHAQNAVTALSPMRALNMDDEDDLVFSPEPALKDDFETITTPQLAVTAPKLTFDARHSVSALQETNRVELLKQIGELNTELINMRYVDEENQRKMKKMRTKIIELEEGGKTIQGLYNHEVMKQKEVGLQNEEISIKFDRGQITIKKLEIENSNMSKALQRTQDECETMERENLGLVAELKEHRNLNQLLEKELEALKEKHTDLQLHFDTDSNAVERLTDELKTERELTQKLTASLATLQRDNEELSFQLKIQTNAANIATNEASQLGIEVEALRTSLETMQAETTSSLNVLNGQEADLDALRAKISRREAIVVEREGLLLEREVELDNLQQELGTLIEMQSRTVMPATVMPTAATTVTNTKENRVVERQLNLDHGAKLEARLKRLRLSVLSPVRTVHRLDHVRDRIQHNSPVKNNLKSSTDDIIRLHEKKIDEDSRSHDLRASQLLTSSKLV